MDTNLTKCEAILPKVRVHPTIWWQENIKLSKVIHTCYHDNRPNTDHTRLDTHTHTDTQDIQTYIFFKLFVLLSITHQRSKQVRYVSFSLLFFLCVRHGANDYMQHCPLWLAKKSLSHLHKSSHHTFRKAPTDLKYEPCIVWKAPADLWGIFPICKKVIWKLASTALSLLWKPY